MADPFIDFYEDQSQDHLASLPITSITSEDHTDNNFDCNININHNTWSSCNSKKISNTHIQIISPLDSGMFGAIEELMVPEFFHDGSPKETAEPESISIWDLINDNPGALTLIKEEEDIGLSLSNNEGLSLPCVKEEPDLYLSFLKQEDPSMSHVKPEGSDLRSHPHGGLNNGGFQFRPIDTQDTYRYKDSQFFKRRFDSLPLSSSDVPQSGATRFKASSPLERKRSISKMPLNELYDVMGLPHDHQLALEREEQIMGILERHGFEVGEKTWIRDTEEPARRFILEAVHNETFQHFGYSKRLLEAIIRRGTYARMQSNLRRRRRRRRRLDATSF